MRKFIITALMAATAIPTVAIPATASAQSNRELNRDRRDIQDERGDLRDAQRRGNRGDVRDAREDLREANQEYREDLRDRNGNWTNRNGYGTRNWGRNDWNSYRNSNRSIYARGNWRAPFRYNTFRVGGRIAPLYFGSRYWINDPWRYRLPRPRPYTRWIRHYNDVVLVDYRRGIVIDTYRNFFW